MPFPLPTRHSRESGNPYTPGTRNVLLQRLGIDLMEHWTMLIRMRMILPVLGGLVALLTLACGGGAPAVPTQEPTTAPAAAASGELTTIVATKELGIGTQRVAFLLTTDKALVTVPEVEVTSFYVGEGGPLPGKTKTAPFHPWPYGVRGTYVTEMEFDRAGPWRLDIKAVQDGETVSASIDLDVAETGHVPQVGAVPPLSENKTLGNSGSIEKITTDWSPDPDLYRLTVAEAVTTGLPTVIVFASPAFCTSPTCGPQTDTVSELKEGYVGRANFIHVEIYENPDEIQGDLSKAGIAGPVAEWGISSIPGWFNESWTFVLDGEGRIAQRFEGFATLEELKAALDPVLLSG